MKPFRPAGGFPPGDLKSRASPPFSRRGRAAGFSKGVRMSDEADKPAVENSDATTPPESPTPPAPDHPFIVIAEIMAKAAAELEQMADRAQKLRAKLCDDYQMRTGHADWLRAYLSRVEPLAEHAEQLLAASRQCRHELHQVLAKTGAA